MKLRPNQTLNLHPQLWRTRVHVLFMFARFMTLAAWVLYLQGMNYDVLLARGDFPYARGLNISANKGINSNRNSESPAVSTPFVSTPATHFRVQSVASRNQRMRAFPVAHGLVVPPPPALFNV